MNKLTIKDIAKYLPYGVAAYNIDFGYGGSPTNVDNVMGRLRDNNVCFEFRPLSQLIEEITHDGMTFVPIVELAKIAGFGIIDPVCLYQRGMQTYTVYTVHCNESTEGLNYTHSSYSKNKQSGFSSVHNFFYTSCDEFLFQKLYEWHFWTGDQSYFKQNIIIEKPLKD